MALIKARYPVCTLPEEPLWETRAATQEDCEWLHRRLSAASLNEIEATSKYRPLTALLQDLVNKKVICDTRRPHQPVALLYLHPNPDNSEEAGFWCAVTRTLEQSDWLCSFVTYTTGIIEHFNRVYPKLLTSVDARNVHQLDLLKQFGFVVAHSLPQYGRKELPFHLLERKTPQYV